MSLFPLCGFLTLGALNWSTAQVSSVFEAFFLFFFVLICGGEVRSLGEVGGLVPLRLLRTLSMTLHASVLVGDWTLCLRAIALTLLGGCSFALNIKTITYLPDAELYGRRPYSFVGRTLLFRFGEHRFLLAIFSVEAILDLPVFLLMRWSPI